MKNRLIMLVFLAAISNAQAGEFTLYLKAGLGADLDPQHDQVLSYNPDCCLEWHRQDFLKPGALADITLGLESRPLFIELRHVSSISDGFQGHGLTWASVGARIDLWKSGN